MERLAYGAEALAHHEGRVVFVPYVAPGERVRVRIVERRAGFVRAELSRRARRRSRSHRATLSLLRRVRRLSVAASHGRGPAHRQGRHRRGAARPPRWAPRRERSAAARARRSVGVPGPHHARGRRTTARLPSCPLALAGRDRRLQHRRSRPGRAPRGRPRLGGRAARRPGSCHARPVRQGRRAGGRHPPPSRQCRPRRHRDPAGSPRQRARRRAGRSRSTLGRGRPTRPDAARARSDSSRSRRTPSRR